MIQSKLTFLGSLLFMIGLSLSNSAIGQVGASGASRNPDATAGSDTAGLGNSMSTDQLNKLANYVDDAHAITRKHIKNPPTKEELMKTVSPFLEKLNLACKLTNVELVGLVNKKVNGRPVLVNGKPSQISVYEVACSNGMGYFITSDESIAASSLTDPTGNTINASAISCFAAEGSREADEANGMSTDFYCQLPENADIKAMAGKLINAAGTPCNVSQLHWYGMSSAAQLEYTEVKCDNNSGYLLRTPLLGANVATSVLSCEEAAKRSLDCRMTKVAPVAKLPTIETFKDYLAHAQVECSVTQVHYIGRENIKKRWVVEFQCPQQPKGLVAYIPLEDNTNKFETINCEDAAKRGVSCKLTMNAKN